MTTAKLGFIGAGNMATAILGGVLREKIFLPGEIILADPDSLKLDELGKLGVQVTKENTRAAKAEIVFLAVKPQMMDMVLEGIGNHMAGKCVVSIAPGISSGYIRSKLPGAHVIRVMPNTPLLVGKGATAVALSPGTPEAEFKQVLEIFSAAGDVAVLPEEQMDAIVSVSGSSPAYFFRMADAMVAEAVREGLDAGVALQMAARTMEGAASMLLESEKTPGELTKQVCSPGGTTLAALTAFDEFDFEKMIAEAMARCTKRTKELGK